MKLVCDSCGTKYSISDEKIAGKAFKIRCKTCSHVMVVRGADDKPKLVAERNENSQLFTLGALAQIATPPAPQQPASTLEGSGLLDIRSLASALAAKPAAAPATIDELPIAPAVGFGEPIVLV